MPSGVGARGRAVHALAASVLAVAGLLVFASPAHAQAAPSGGVQVNKVEIGGTADARFTVTGPDDFSADLSAHVVAENTVTPATPTLTALAPGTYEITETAPIDPNTGQSVWELTDVECDGGNPEVNLGAGVVSITVSDALVTCTFTDTVTRAATAGTKTVIGDTSTWTRPARFHFSCPDQEIEVDLPPIGPGGPGTYSLGQGSIPPGTCTLTETDTGSDSPVTVSMVVTNHGSLIASGSTSVTFTSEAGDDIAVFVTNVFSSGVPPERPEQGTTTTVAGSTTTTASTTTTVPAATTTIPSGGGETTIPSGGGETTTTPTTSAPATTQAPLPTTGSPTGGLVVAALVAMLLGLTLVARSRRFLD